MSPRAVAENVAKGGITQGSVSFNMENHGNTGTPVALKKIVIGLHAGGVEFAAVRAAFIFCLLRIYPIQLEDHSPAGSASECTYRGSQQCSAARSRSMQIIVQLLLLVRCTTLGAGICCIHTASTCFALASFAGASLSLCVLRSPRPRSIFLGKCISNRFALVDLLTWGSLLPHHLTKHEESEVFTQAW